MLCLTVAHNIFLTREQRYQLAQTENCRVDVVGHSTPVWVDGDNTDEPADEIFCRYTLTNYDNSEMIEFLPSGYRIHISDVKDRLSLLDTCDRGGESLIFTHHRQMALEGVEFFAIHFVSINDVSILE